MLNKQLDIVALQDNVFCDERIMNRLFGLHGTEGRKRKRGDVVSWNL